ncbi:MAG: hypothetical protein Q8M88_08940 [Phenylobacterium sp.]|uniref:DUF4870 family protein n=1 Tax=Phenylobacterium sp. TaxID=1871053 RepID=UPI002734D328|nr:hypothetical protein [Phenylobacterium sp.]MDP3174544.1 hypothetical protein [Phenylobacterium sp.]
MSEPVHIQPLPAPTTFGRLLPASAYALYFIGLANGVTILLGLILAYVNRDKADAATRSHYDFLIGTFWLGIAWAVIGSILVIVGLPLSLVLIGLPVVALGWIILSLLGVWFIARLVIGSIYLARSEAYPRPKAWLI